MVHNLGEQPSLVAEWLRQLRDTGLQQDRARFRKNLMRIGQVAAYEISRTMSYVEVDSQTPLGIARTRTLAQQPVIATVLRAGLPLFDGLMDYFDQADAAFVGAYRKHDAAGGFTIKQDYVACPSTAGRTLIVADTMLATGASLVQAITQLLENGKPETLHVVCVLATTAGVQTLAAHFPEAHIWVGAVDAELSAKGYIVPGLGDAGDLAFGEKLQY